MSLYSEATNQAASPSLDRMSTFSFRRTGFNSAMLAGSERIPRARGTPHRAGQSPSRNDPPLYSLQSAEEHQLYRQFPPWSLAFQSFVLEDEFFTFVSPGWLASLFIYVISAILGVTSYLTAKNDLVETDPIMRYTLSTKLVHMSLSLLFCLLSVALRLALYRKVVSPLDSLRWNRRFRVAFNFVMAFTTVNLALESRNCAGDGHPVSYVARCFRSYPTFAVSPLPLSLVSPVGFNAMLTLLILPIAEIAFSISATTSMGLPIEQRFTRPFFITFLTCLYLFFYYTHERQDRVRFLASKRLRELAQTAKARKEQVATTLAEICDTEQLGQLLSGRISNAQHSTATILITAVEGFVAWRREWFPDDAIAVLNSYFEAVEEIRGSLPAIECIAYRGDQLIAAVGIVRNGPPQVAGSTQNPADPSVLVSFALKQRLLAIRIADRSGVRQTRFPPLKLRWGIARGDCVGVLVPGSVVYSVLWGEAFEEARKNLAEAPTGLVELPRSLISHCEEIEIRYGQSPRGADFVICTSIRSRPRSNNLMVPGIEAQNLGSQSTMEFLNSVSSSRPLEGEGLVVTPSRRATTPTSSAESEGEVHRKTSATEIRNEAEQVRFVDYFLTMFQQPEGFAEFQERQAQADWMVGVGVWFTLLVIYTVVFLIEEQLDVAYAILLFLGLISLSMPMLPVFTSKRWATLFMSIVQLGVYIGFAVIRQSSILTAYVTLLLNMPLVTFLYVGSHLPTVTIVAVAGSYFTVGIFLSYLHPGRLKVDPLRMTIFLIVAAVFNVAIVITRALHSRRTFDFHDSHEKLKTAAVKEQNFHENVLGMLLPKFVVPLIVKRQERIHNEEAIFTDILPDVSLLTMKYSPFASWQEMVRVSTCMDRFIMESSARTLHLIYADGDVFSFGGPLQKNLNDLKDKPATSQFAGRAIGRRLAREELADEAASELIKLLDLIASVSNTRFCAVLHRGDGLASVLGLRRPTFALFGPVTEVSMLILGLLDDQASTFNKLPCVATGAFVAHAQRFEPNWVATLPMPVPFAVKSLGIVRVHPMQMQSKCS